MSIIGSFTGDTRADKCVGDERKCSVTNRTITTPPYNVSMVPFIPVGHLVLWPNTLSEMDKSPFLPIEQPSISILPLLQKAGDRLPDESITAFWNHCDHIVTLKKNTTIGYVREADYRENHISEHQNDTAELTEIPHEKLPPMSEKSTFMFHHSFYPKPKIDLEDAQIAQKMQKNLHTLKQTMMI